jgi:mono/diheme cytochrome c family protein
VGRVARIVPWIVAAAVSGSPEAARSQSNIDAGRSPEQIFADTCNACHGAAHELKSTDAAFLRKHYTTGARQAAAMAAFLQMAINNPPPPTPVTAAAAKSRRPSESMEEAASAASIADPGLATPPRAAAAAPLGEIEE